MTSETVSKISARTSPRALRKVPRYSPKAVPTSLSRISSWMSGICVSRERSLTIPGCGPSKFILFPQYLIDHGAWCSVGAMQAVDTLQIPDVIGGVGSHVLAIEHVERTQTLQQLAAESFERQVHDLAAELPGQQAPRGLGQPGTGDRDVTVLAMQETRGQQPFLEGRGELEPGIGPDLGDRPGREQEERPAVHRLGNTRSHQVLHRIRGIKSQGRFLGVLGEPGGPMSVNLGIGRHLEQEDDGLDRTAAGRQHLDVEIARVPVAQGFPDVDAVADAGRELLDPGKVRPENGFGLVADMAVKTLDPIVFVGPGTHAKGVPALPPTLLLPLH